MTKNLSREDQTLASEFAMGLLEGDALTSARARMETDHDFALLVQDWQEKLTPMLNEIQPVTPDSAVWNKIVTRTTGEITNKTGIWGSLTFWRGFSLVTSTAIAVLLFVSPLTVPLQNQPLVASLTATGKTPAFLARFDPNTGGLVIRTGLRDAKETRVAELWLIPGDGVPRSLGLLDRDGAKALSVSGKNKPLFAKGGTLAVSLEPLGGSPTGAPTGPVIASGKLQFL